MSYHSLDNGEEEITFKGELKIWSKIVGSMTIFILCRVGMDLTDVIFLGHLGDLELEAASTASIWIDISMVAIYEGSCSAINMLCSTAFGARNFRLTGIWFQIGILVSLLLDVLIGTSWFFAGQIMQKLLGFDEEFRDKVNVYSRFQLIGLVPSTIFQCLNSYLLSQNIVLPQLIATVSTFGLNIFLNWILIHGTQNWEGFGFAGSPIATSISRTLLFLVVSIYVLARKLHLLTWPGFTTECLKRQRIKVFLEQFFPMALSALLENTQLQVMAVFAGVLGKIELATHNGCFQVIFFLLSPMFGIMDATRTRIGNHLGNKQIPAAKMVMKIAFCTSLVIGAIVAMIWYICKNFIGRIFTSDDEIIADTASLAILVGSSYIGLALFLVSMATLAAQGRPVWVACCFLLGAWFITVPLGYVLGPSKIVYKTPKSGLLGIWIAMLVGYIVTTMASLIGICLTDWEDVVKKTIERAEVCFLNVQSGESRRDTRRNSGLTYFRGTRSPSLRSLNSLIPSNIN